MSKTAEQIRSEITTALMNQNINTLVNTLAEANAKIEELTAKVAALEKKEP
jgi:hypothetical protein